MTLAEARMDKVMSLTGKLHKDVDITDLFHKVYAVGVIKITTLEEGYGFSYEGGFEEGCYVIGQIIEATQKVKQAVRLEVKCHFK